MTNTVKSWFDKYTTFTKVFHSISASWSGHPCRNELNLGGVWDNEQCQHTSEIKDPHQREVAAEEMSWAYWRRWWKRVTTAPCGWATFPTSGTIITDATLWVFCFKSLQIWISRFHWKQLISMKVRVESSSEQITRLKIIAWFPNRFTVTGRAMLWSLPQTS